MIDDINMLDQKKYENTEWKDKLCEERHLEKKGKIIRKNEGSPQELRNLGTI